MWKRVFIVMLAVWLIFSTFAWPHRDAHLANTLLVGAGLVIFGALSTAYGWARVVTLALSIWLLLFVILVKPLEAFTFWNNAMVALFVFVLSLLESNRVSRRTMPAHHPPQA
jgi:hypothetical protein